MFVIFGRKIFEDLCCDWAMGNFYDCITSVSFLACLQQARRLPPAGGGGDALTLQMEPHM